MFAKAFELNNAALSLDGNAGRVDILHNISLSINVGTSVGLLGPSGSGKSSLLMLLGGLERATGGTVQAMGRDLTAMTEDQLALFRRDHMGVVFQSFHLIPTMTALENVATPLELAGVADAFDRAAAELQAVGLGHRMTHYPNQMSGGEQQRVALARAAAPEPDILLADAATGMARAIESVVAFGNTTANTFEGALLAVREIWSRLPDVIGDLVFSAANRMLDGIEAMLNGAIRRIDAFTGRIRDALAAVGIETTFGQIGEISLGDIPNPFSGASADGGTAAAEAFRRAFEDAPLSAPDLGLQAIAADALETANIYRRAATDLANGSTTPLTSWGALRDAVAGTGEEGAAALDEATASADRLSNAMGRAGGAAGSAGDRIATGWRAVSESLQAYATDALNWGKGLGETLTGAFSSAENAFRSFVETGKFDFKSLVRSILVDLAVLSFKRAVLGPIASALSGIFGGGSVAAAVSHAGGIVGLSGHSRSVPAVVFAGAPRMHSGGWTGLRPDEVPTILQRGERVLSRRETASYGASPNGAQPVTIHIDARGAQAGVAEQIAEKLAQVLPSVRKIAREEVSMRLGRGYAL